MGRRAVDPQVLATLRGLQREGEPDVLEQLAEMFYEDAAAACDAMQAGVEAADAERVERAAHALKSSSANLGARDLSALCGGLERRARLGDLDGASEAVARIRDEHDAVCRDLRELV